MDNYISRFVELRLKNTSNVRLLGFTGRASDDGRISKGVYNIVL